MPPIAAHSSPCHAMLLAAGRGSRLRPLTDSTPKPLIEVGQRPLLQWHLEALTRQSNIHRVCINIAWLGVEIQDYFGNAFQLQDFLPEGAELAAVAAAHNRRIELLYSDEAKVFGSALETAGGICRALPQLADVFWLAAGDALLPDFAFAQEDYRRFAASDALAQLWLVPNPPFREDGDFGIDFRTGDNSNSNSNSGTGGDINGDINSDINGDIRGIGCATLETSPRLSFTYSGVGLFRKALFQPPFCDIAQGNPDGVAMRLADVLRPAVAQQRVLARVYSGYWQDVGTADRLADARAYMQTWRGDTDRCDTAGTV